MRVGGFQFYSEKFRKTTIKVDCEAPERADDGVYRV